MTRFGNLGLGSLIAICTLGGVGVVIAVNGQHMFSSGPLKDEHPRKTLRGGVHAHAEIANNCAACHASPSSAETMADRCLACHTDIRSDITANIKMHGLLDNAMQCMKCHTEHKGPHANLTSLEFFNHDHTAFKLTGKHAEVKTCGECHKDQLFRGTATTCTSCHAEPKVHLGKFGTDCAQCHTTQTWHASSVTLTKFDHNLTAFKLTGHHQQVACASCHKNNTYQGTPTSCVACHAEPAVPAVHRGHYGKQCTQCHTTTAFVGTTLYHPFPIDHHARGKRTNICANCHNDLTKLQQYTCYNCHEHARPRMVTRHARFNLTSAQLDACAKCHGNGRTTRRVAELAPPNRQLAALLSNDATACPEKTVGGCPHSDGGDPLAALFQSASRAEMPPNPAILAPSDSIGGLPAPTAPPRFDVLKLFRWNPPTSRQ